MKEVRSFPKNFQKFFNMPQHLMELKIDPNLKGDVDFESKDFPNVTFKVENYVIATPESKLFDTILLLSTIK